MKEFKLSSWPDLPPAYQHSRYRRMVHELANRHVSARHLARACGSSRGDVRRLLALLDQRGLLDQRELPWQQRLFVAVPLLARLLGRRAAA